MQGKSALLAGVAVIALVATAQAGYAAKKSSDATSVTPATTTAAPPAGPSNAELAARIQALEDALQSDEGKASSDHTRLSTLEQNFNYATWTFDNGRPVINSGDGRFSMAFRVRFQEDFASFMQRDMTKLSNANVQYKDLSTGASTRRAFFGVEGKAFKDFWYEFRYNAGGGGGAESGDPAMSIARVAYTGIDHFRINVGIIEPAMMLEGTTSSGQLMFLERPEIENIAADTFGAGDARRGIEVAFQYENAFLPGDNFIWTAAYTGGKTVAPGGTAAGHGNGGDEQTQFLSHLSYRFWSDGPSNALIGFDYGTVLYAGGVTNSGGGINFQDRPQIRVDGTRLISTGSFGAAPATGCKTGGATYSCHATMFAGHIAGNYENFYLGGEYAYFRDDRNFYNSTSKTNSFDHPNFSGYILEGSWVLTGEPKGYSVNATNNEIGGYGAPKVANPFSLDGESWGAFELVARYSFTNLDWNRSLTSGVAGGRESIGDIGLNWYLNNEVKVQLHDSFVHVNKFKAAGTATQVGQDLNIVGIRLQFSN